MTSVLSVLTEILWPYTTVLCSYKPAYSVSFPVCVKDLPLWDSMAKVGSCYLEDSLTVVSLRQWLHPADHLVWHISSLHTYLYLVFSFLSSGSCLTSPFLPNLQITLQPHGFIACFLFFHDSLRCLPYSSCIICSCIACLLWSKSFHSYNIINNEKQRSWTITFTKTWLRRYE